LLTSPWAARSECSVDGTCPRFRTLDQLGTGSLAVEYPIEPSNPLPPLAPVRDRYGFSGASMFRERHATRPLETTSRVRAGEQPPAGIPTPSGRIPCPSSQSRPSPQTDHIHSQAAGSSLHCQRDHPPQVNRSTATSLGPAFIKTPTAHQLRGTRSRW
jgi:hypothetical protein